MFVTNWISTTKIQKISEITNFFRHYFLSRTEVKIRLFRFLPMRFVRFAWIREIKCEKIMESFGRISPKDKKISPKNKKISPKDS